MENYFKTVVVLNDSVACVHDSLFSDVWGVDFANAKMHRENDGCCEISLQSRFTHNGNYKL